MASAARIGALRVDLGLNSAQFEAGLARSQSRMAAFGRMAGLGLAAVAAAAVAAAAGIAVAVKGMLDEADQLTKLAQSIGIPVEELSRLKHAAELSGVSLEQLGVGVRSLSQRLLQVAQGSGEEARRAFDALGISVTNADGTLRSSSEVISEVANRFASMEDGTAKTALALQLFGRQGAAMIPLLNQGADGIEAMKAEADALGIVIDQKTGRAAERFNDNLKRLGEAFNGIVLAITRAVLPALNSVIQYFVDTTSGGQALQVAMGALDVVFKLFASSLIVVGAAVGAVSRAFMGLVGALQALGSLDLEGAWASLSGGMLDIGKTVEDAARSVGELWGLLEAPPDMGVSPAYAALKAMFFGTGLPPGEPPWVPTLVAGAERVKLSFQDLKDTFGLVEKEATASMSDMAGDLSGILGKIFGDSKAAAIAQAVLNTYQGISKTLANYPWPMAGIMASLHAAAGLVQIAKIRSTSERSSSASAAGLGAGGAAVASQPAAPASSQAVNVHLRGSFVTRDQIAQLIAEINAAIGDGARIRLAAA